VVVRRNAVTNDDLPAAISQFVHDITWAGGYLPDQLPPKVMHVHHLGYYVGQVCNGGHAQFFHNCGETFQTVAAGALAALKAMGAEKQHQALAAMAAWAETSSEESREAQVNALDGFEKLFWAGENERPIEPLLGRWISSWPELRVVDNGRYDPAIDEIAALNPSRGPSLVWRNVQGIRYQMTDPVQIAIAAACGAVEPEPETKIRVARPMRWEVEGEQCVAHAVWTLKGKRLCVCDDAGARLYAHKPDQADAGSRLSAVDAATIKRFVKVANETQAPEAIDLVLRRADVNPAAMITAWEALENEARWIAFTYYRVVVARTSPHGATLTDLDGRQLAAITKADIERHAAEIERGAAKMQAPT
jgi:hypothetical protein